MSDKNIVLSYIFLSVQDECLSVRCKYVSRSCHRTGALSNSRPWLVMADFLEAVDFEEEPRMNADKR
jgi:hypothetical protein